MLDIELTIELLILLCSVAFAAGFIDAVAGGGGLLTIPALLSAGLPAHIALGTNKLAATFGSFVASLTFYRKKLFNLRYWRLSIVFTAVGAIAGTVVVDYLSPELLNKVLPVVIAATALYTLFNRVKPDHNIHLPQQSTNLKVKQCSQAVTLGFYDGIAGPGTGAFWVVSNTVLYKINLLLSSGVARAMNFVSNICSLTAFIFLGHVHFALGIAMGLCLMVGALIGSHYAIKLGSKFIRPVFISVVLLLTAKLLWQAWL
ncbi:TSUP family transporter [Flocculibacter collagenilyticus]|uniref:TSUP family transporter n=1 Tax=Flocculibacter collagenilyticus TaxID=2744479 RepID=UPI0018F3760D|nr:TSUP family transporter [Flocculibacter collagenilyticus]